jgi:hypothetical protein
MKNVREILITALLFLCIVIKGKTQVPDTAQYLIDSIQPKLSYYIGKPLKVLLQDLKINPVEYKAPFYAELPKNKDTVSFERTLLEFYNLDARITRTNNGIKSPAIVIWFVSPIPIPKKWLMRGGIFEKLDWDIRKQRFF